MLNYILKRIWQMVPTVVGVVLLTFILFNVVGGDLAAIALGKKVSLQSLEAFDEQRGLNKPLFFGTRATSRAYEDQDLAEGAGRWRSWSNALYSAETASVSIQPNAKIDPLAFPLESGAEFVWQVTYRGAGSLAGGALASADWKSAKIRFKGSEEGGFATGAEGLEIKKLKLRKVMKNPFDSQLWFYVKQLARGDMGYSESLKQPVSKLLKDGVLPSLSLTIPIFLIGIVLSVSLSLVCAFFRDTFIDRFLVMFSVALMSINYLVYIVAGQYFLAYKQGLFPVWGFESARYLVLPVLIGVISGLGANIRFYRTVMLDEMYKDYVRTAFAKGVAKPRVLFVHVLKNAMIPIITNVVIAIPYLYTGSLLLESFFGIPGLGYLSINAILAADIDVIRAIVLIGAMLFVACNLLTDICYALADPRVKLK
ncbi:Glutathione transport system permease protein GsiC [Pontiella desulfatans]|uniref:Glutathione transport system permease protein GsiC n=1 Tax=Pontiella desulfatans TaxID=2750659 RepID=A0A6C2U446_PONDE|nr:ABC transporter permease [Pontiella desulfatans]VGO14599.1 Glutathione transport system permease protein GsiC [Pontiella desulfatans]